MPRREYPTYHSDPFVRTKLCSPPADPFRQWNSRKPRASNVARYWTIDEFPGAHLINAMRADYREQQEENQRLSAPDELKKAIPGDTTYGQLYTSQVITSLRKKHPIEVKSFADFVAKKIMEKLKDKFWADFNNQSRSTPQLETYDDLLVPYYIKNLYELKSGTASAFLGDNRGLLHIEKLEEQFREWVEKRKCAKIDKSRELFKKTYGIGYFYSESQPKEKTKEEKMIEDESDELLKTIPVEAVSPNTTISGGFSAIFSCCSDRGASRPKIQVRNTNTPVR